MPDQITREMYKWRKVAAQAPIGEPTHSLVWCKRAAEKSVWQYGLNGTRTGPIADWLGDKRLLMHILLRSLGLAYLKLTMYMYQVVAVTLQPHDRGRIRQNHLCKTPSSFFILAAKITFTNMHTIFLALFCHFLSE